MRQVYHAKVGILIIVYAGVNFTSRFLRMPMRGRQTSSVQIYLEVLLRSWIRHLIQSPKSSQLIKVGLMLPFTPYFHVILVIENLCFYHVSGSQIVLISINIQYCLVAHSLLPASLSNTGFHFDAYVCCGLNLSLV